MTRLLDVGEVAELIGCSRKWVRKHAALGHVPSVRLPGLLRFDADDIEAWLVTRKVTVADPTWSRTTHRRDELAALRQRLTATPDRRRKKPPARRASA